jgi:tetratricopeptide (TPR) repeat protein
VEAWARLAVARCFLWNNSTPTPELAVQARTAAERARALAPKDAAPALAMALYYRTVARQNELALQTLQDVLPLAPKDPLILSSLAATELNLGHVESALEHLQEARRLDPRSLVLMYNMGTSLLSLRRYHEADSVLGRALELEPGNLNGILFRVQARLGRGDLRGARAIVSRAAAELDPRTVGVHLATYYELHWVLDSAQQALVVGSRPDDFNDDTGSWGLAHANIYTLWGDRVRARAYADSARAAFSEQLRATPDDPQTVGLLALALALRGITDESIRQGERATQLLPVSQDPSTGLYLEELLARIYVMAGKPEKAVERLDVVLAKPWYISRDWLRIDPHYAPIRTHPAFARLLAGGS